MGEKKRSESLARASDPSHGIVLPGVKMDLAVVLLLLACLWFMVAASGLSAIGEIAALLGGGLAASGWLMWRTRRALARACGEARTGGGPEGDNGSE